MVTPRIIAAVEIDSIHAIIITNKMKAYLNSNAF
jgi:hypothetical protein